MKSIESAAIEHFEAGGLLSDAMLAALSWQPGYGYGGMRSAGGGKSGFCDNSDTSSVGASGWPRSGPGGIGRYSLASRPGQNMRGVERATQTAATELEAAAATAAAKEQEAAAAAAVAQEQAAAEAAAEAAAAEAAAAETAAAEAAAAEAAATAAAEAAASFAGAPSAGNRLMAHTASSGAKVKSIKAKVKVAAAKALQRWK
jgi:hypothetical protein